LGRVVRSCAKKTPRNENKRRRDAVFHEATNRRGRSQGGGRPGKIHRNSAQEGVTGKAAKRKRDGRKRGKKRYVPPKKLKGRVRKPSGSRS